MTPAHDDSNPFITTYTGRRFHPLAPKPEEVCLADIAHALSMKCRYGGHCAQFYSVAEHSILVAALVPPEYRVEALLHDAAEAYLADLAWPLKRSPEMRSFLEVEDRILTAVFQRFGVHPAAGSFLSQCVKEADRRAQDLEWPELMPSEGTNLAGVAILHGATPLRRRLSLMSPTVAKGAFQRVASGLGVESGC